MWETCDEMDQIECDVKVLVAGQLSGLKTSLEDAFNTETEVHVHLITINFYTYAQKMP